MRLAPAAALLVLASCSRELSIPEKQTLAVGPTFTSVSPRETVPFVASGGAGGYAYGFAEGGKLSGADAAIDPDTGLYRAGRLGSALDVVVVTDAAGRTATATVSVGPRLALTPSVGATAPGGPVFFTATGGKAPYAFALSSAPSGGTIGASSGAYVAGPTGDVQDEVIVTDQTGDAAASASAIVRVSSAVRLYRGTTGAVAPLETIVLTALGGQPPHRFEMASSPSGGTIGALTGEYRAGPRGDRTDRVRVLDALDQSDELDVAVGPELRLAAPAGALRPGASARLVASGGKGPYAYGFAPFSNRSGGTIETATGDYTPGPNAGAVDVVAAMDAVGAATTLRLPAVGAPVVGAGTGVTRCLAADLNGDGREDAVLLDFEKFSNAFRQLTTLSLPLGATPEVHRGWIDPARANDTVTIGDFAGTGRDQLAFLGENGFWTLAPDAFGNLTFGPSIPASLFFPTGAVPGRRYAITSTRTATGTRFYTGAPCTVPSNGVTRFDWPAGASAPTAVTTCEPVGWTDPPMHLLATDLNGDGRVDLVWTEYGASANSSNGPVRFAAGLVGGGFAAPLSFAFQTAGAILNHDHTLVETAGGVFLSRTSGLSFLRRGSGASPAWATGSWPYVPQGIVSFTAGIAARGPSADRVVAWDPYGTFVGVDVAGSTPSSVTILPGTGRLADFTSCGAFPDLDGDAVEDLVASVFDQADTQVFFGDGDGRFGSRFRFAVDGPSCAAGGDVSGDGIPDLLAATSAPGLRVLAGGDHLLAYGDQTGAPAPLTAVAAGRVGPGGTAGLVAADEAVRVYAAGVAGGAVAPPTLLQSMNRGLTAVETLLVADLGSADARDDVFLVTRQGDETYGYDYLVDELLLGSSPTFVTGPFLTAPFRCAFLPVGTSDVASACTTDRNDVVLGRSTRSGSTLPVPSAQVTYPGTGGTRASMVGAGLLAGGRAVLVVAPSAPGAISATAVAIAPPFTVTTSALAGIGEPVTSAALGDLDADGTADLVVRSGRRLYAYRGDPAAPGSFTTSLATVEVAGSVRAVVPLAGGAAGDVVLESGDRLVVLRNDGAGGLR